ncbi:MAG: NADH-quinone oxidoreductase subunit L [Phycisphaeraceae bacterium]
MTESSQNLIAVLATTALLLPLISSAVVILATRRLLFKATGVFTTAVMGLSFVCSLVILFMWTKGSEPIVHNLKWIPIPGTEAGWLHLGVMIDGLTVAMLVMVTGVSTLVHLYSIGYMEGDKRYNWFFAYLSLFAFSMLGIVVANSLIMLFIFWELVGLTSYLLIGFWFEKRGPQLACTKAFVMNRIGDTGFLIGFGILFYKLGGNVLLPAAEGGMFDAIKQLIEADGYSITRPPMWLTAAGIGLFFGAIGKSAQFPLHTWLPDAMEGPTPVSSIVHSATMVAAGVYLTGRIYPILTPAAHLFIATIGLITLVMAACMAMVMTDIKRVLAYSTLSQLGYMILGMGVGSYAFALFHLISHAFFKCCLFQCAGSVIHAANHEQDMRQYGGLGRKLPMTMACYAVCMVTISGVGLMSFSFFSGFYSKDGIIAGAVAYGDALRGWGPLFYWGPLIIAYVTPFYMARSFALTFLGKPRNQRLYDGAHEAPYTMVVSQMILAAMAILAVPWIMPFWFNLIDSSRQAMVAGGVSWVLPVDHHGLAHGFHIVHNGLLYGLAGVVMIVVGGFMYKDGFRYSSRIVALPIVKPLYTWALNKFYFDELYDHVTVGLGRLVAAIMNAIDEWLVDGLVVNGAAWATKWWSFGVGRFDNDVVDGIANGAADMAQAGGNVLRATQVGRIRAYVLLLFVSAALATLLTVTVVLVVG